ncbi:hypothetical protein thalar_01796 [Litoreibacter arenae DSM 19593]|uniref:Uncharacterized protein n=1 Tax=Litoreibacter arenae DSM 19593 TaxID=1123360 RepID=S9RLH7_9RHOB|nr:hypothetical protein thalar_01796 [Litoreibacter arenae DSM 19593]
MARFGAVCTTLSPKRGGGSIYCFETTAQVARALKDGP